MEAERVILIADDEAHIRLLIEQSLEDLADEGVTILAVGDATGRARHHQGAPAQARRARRDDAQDERL